MARDLAGMRAGMRMSHTCNQPLTHVYGHSCNLTVCSNFKIRPMSSDLTALATTQKCSGIYLRFSCCQFEDQITLNLLNATTHKTKLKFDNEVGGGHLSELSELCTITYPIAYPHA